jgi:DNA-binding NarL/FixJ family response regulator
MPTSVLVAADLRLVRDWLAHDLASAPDLIVAGAAPDRPTTLSLVRKLSPDALLLDRSMPDGLLAVLDVVAERPRMRVLAFGVQETEPEIAVCSDAGVHGFIPRDATRDALIESVRRTVRGEFVGSATVSALLLRHFVHRTAPLAGHGLTGREMEIVKQLELGRSNKEIAVVFGIEVATVKNHVHNLLRKLRARRRSEAAAKWRSCGRGGNTTWVARRAG